MISNKTIRVITFFLTIASLLVLIILAFSESKNFYYDLALAIFGSSALSWVTAQISFISDIRKIKRNIISNVLQIQSEVKKILSEYNKTLNYWDEKDFYESNLVLRKIIGEFFSYSDTIKFETGKNISELVKLENLVDIYKSYISLNSGIYDVGVLVNSQNKESAFENYKKCIELDKEIVKKIETLLRKEYGKHFAEINTIGLL